MITYKLFNSRFGNLASIQRSDGWSIPIVADNTDYRNFINEINNDKAQLEDADGNLMTQEEAKAFVATLPQGDK